MIRRNTSIKYKYTSNTEFKKCKFCYKDIPLEAKICTHCNSRQNKINQYVIAYQNLILVPLTVITVWFTYKQYKSAQDEAVKAKEAVRKAEEAKESVYKVQNDINKSYDSILKLSNKTTSLYNQLVGIRNESDSYKKHRLLLMNTSKKYSYYVFFDKKSNDLLDINIPRDGTQFHVIQPLENLFFSYINDSKLKISQTNIFDIFTFSLLCTYSEFYKGGWYRPVEYIDLYTSFNKLPVIESEIITGDKLMDKLKFNSTAKYCRNILESIKIYLPAKSDITFNYKTPTDCLITIKNLDFTLQISISNNGSIYDSGRLLKYIGNTKILTSGIVVEEVAAMKINIEANVTFNNNIQLNELNAKEYFWSHQLIDHLEYLFSY